MAETQRWQALPTQLERAEFGTKAVHKSFNYILVKSSISPSSFTASARIEPAIGKLKRCKRIAMRCEKTAESFAAFVDFACGFILVKSVHRD